MFNMQIWWLKLEVIDFQYFLYKCFYFLKFKSYFFVKKCLKLTGFNFSILANTFGKIKGNLKWCKKYTVEYREETGRGTCLFNYLNTILLKILKNDMYPKWNNIFYFLGVIPTCPMDFNSDPANYQNLNMDVNGNLPTIKKRPLASGLPKQSTIPSINPPKEPPSSALGRPDETLRTDSNNPGLPRQVQASILKPINAVPILASTTLAPLRNTTWPLPKFSSRPFFWTTWESRPGHL